MNCLKALLIVTLISLVNSLSLRDLVPSKQIEMPTYDVLSKQTWKHGDIEIRRYPATKWVGTSYQVCFV